MGKRTAVVLLSLGSPSGLKDVEPFLFSLFGDRYVMDMPSMLRIPIAKVISKLRLSRAREIYSLLGGQSVLLQETKSQAALLERVLNERSSSKTEYRVFVCMRHTAPSSLEALSKVSDFHPSRVVLLPMYPQYSFVTTQSAVANWFSTAYKFGYSFNTDIVWCFYRNMHYISAMCDLIRTAYWSAYQTHNRHPRILFTAHGLPISLLRKGDPYEQHVRHSVELILEELEMQSVDHVICYQSRVGPVPWLGPTTKHEVLHAHKNGLPIVVVPISFVSENSETLVELDMEYKAVVCDKEFFRVPTVGTHASFIECLYSLSCES